MRAELDSNVRVDIGLYCSFILELEGVIGLAVDSCAYRNFLPTYSSCATLSFAQRLHPA
ncbi:hypothetical protein D3C76_1799680 [compost metagenome]